MLVRRKATAGLGPARGCVIVRAMIAMSLPAPAAPPNNNLIGMAVIQGGAQC